MCAEAGQRAYVRGICEGSSITCGQVILVLLTGEFTHCIPPSPSLGVLQLEQRVVALDRGVRSEGPLGRLLWAAVLS